MGFDAYVMVRIRLFDALYEVGSPCDIVSRFVVQAFCLLEHNRHPNIRGLVEQALKM